MVQAATRAVLTERATVLVEYAAGNRPARLLAHLIATINLRSA